MFVWVQFEKGNKRQTGRPSDVRQEALVVAAYSGWVTVCVSSLVPFGMHLEIRGEPCVDLSLLLSWSTFSCCMPLSVPCFIVIGFQRSSGALWLQTLATVPGFEWLYEFEFRTCLPNGKYFTHWAIPSSTLNLVKRLEDIDSAFLSENLILGSPENCSKYQ